MNGSQIAQTGNLGTVPDNWSIVGTRDFDGDGRGDILWPNSGSGCALATSLNRPEANLTGVVGRAHDISRPINHRTGTTASYDAIAVRAPVKVEISTSIASVETVAPRSIRTRTLSRSTVTCLAITARIFLAQDGKQIGSAARRPLVGQEDLQPIARNGGRTPAPEQVEHAHAALRPNSLSSKPLRSVGMVIGRASPQSRRAACR